MEFLPHKVDLISLGLGLAIWILVLLLVWWPRPPSSEAESAASYLQWTRIHGMSRMSYQDYINSGEAGGKPLTKVEKTIVVTLIAALVLLVALSRWGAIR